jgi:N-acyl-D-amino-acid deacylase
MKDARDIDVLICGGRLLDGSGNPWRYADVAIAGDRIARIAPRGGIDPARVREVIDASGHVVCPGFIDIQSHSISTLLRDGRSLSKVTQGITTEIMGEAWTPAPLGGKIADPFGSTLIQPYRGPWEQRAQKWTRFRAWLEDVASDGVSVNIGSFLGGGTLREYACAWEMKTATPDQRETMCRVMHECMQEGAFGLASALIYPPGAYADTEELCEIASVIGKNRGVYITHVRSESEKLIEGIQEAIEIGRRGGCAVEIYHLKALGKPYWHRIDAAIAEIEKARAEGLDVTADMYPYTGSGTNLSVLLPYWVSDSGKFFEKLSDAATRKKIVQEMSQPTAWNHDVEAILPVGFLKPENRQYTGKTLGEISRLRGQPWPETVIDLLLAENQKIFTCYLVMSEENVRMQLKLPWVKVSTDAGGHDPAAETVPVHPRAYGTYTRVLGKYVREEKVLSLEDAIRKMTSSVAARLSLSDRGLLCEGFKADVVVFDPATVGDRATFADSHRLSTGIRDVWVNGARVLKCGEHTGAKPGRIVDGPGRKTGAS